MFKFKIVLLAFFFVVNNKLMDKLIAILILMVFQISNVLAQGPEVCQREAIVYCDYYPALFLEPNENENGEEEFCSAVKIKLAELFTRDGFQIIEDVPLVAINQPENEYRFEVKFEAGTSYTSYGPNPKMTLVLKFNLRSFWDQVRWWQVEEPIDTLDMNNWESLLAKLEQSIRKGPDIIEIIEEYEKRPVNCEIGMDKDTLYPGEEIEIYVMAFTDVRGKTSEPFNRIVVHVEEGEIINGAVTDIGKNYYAFQTEYNIVEMHYQAPDNCVNSEEKITIYNSCDVLPEQDYFLHRTKLKKQIEEKEIDIKCNWEWSGTMTVEKLERFDCELDKSTDDSWGHIKLHELSATRATVNIRAENIDDSPPGFNINMGENLIVSGFMKCEYNNTEIIDGRKSGSNPSTSHHKETLVGEDLFDLSHKNLNLMFMANLAEVQKDGSLEEMAKMLESGDIDEAKLEEFGKKLEESMGTGDEGTSKITVNMILFGDCNCKAILTQNGWSVKNGERTTTNESTTLDMPIGGGVALEFTADYKRNKDGSAIITGNYNKTIPIPGGQREGCPPREETITCTLNLSKRPKK